MSTNNLDNSKHVIVNIQEAFLENFVAEGSPRFQQLIAPVGVGKTHTVTTAVCRLIENNNPFRVLFLMPAALAEQVKYRLAELGVGQVTHLLNRQKFREFQADAGAGQSPWPPRCVLLSSIAFARQPDVSEAILSASWDLIVVDEAHRLAGRSLEMIERLAAEDLATRMLFASTLQITGILKSQSVETTDWGPTVMQLREQCDPQTHFHTANYPLSAPERDCFEAVSAICDKVDGSSWVPGILRRRRYSSLFALEKTVRRFRHQLAHGSVSSPAGSQADEEEGSDESQRTWKWEKPEDALLLMDTVLDLLGELETDSKLDATQSLLTEIYTADAEARVCVYSTYADTADYLASSLELGFATMCITGATSFAERQLRFEKFQRSPSVLVCTDVVREGADLRTATHVIHFESFVSDTVKEQRLGRFLRFGREEPLDVFEFEEQ